MSPVKKPPESRIRRYAFPSLSPDQATIQPPLVVGEINGRHCDAKVIWLITNSVPRGCR